MNRKTWQRGFDLCLGLFVLGWAIFLAKAPVQAAAGQEVEITKWYFHRFSLILSPYSCHAGKAGCYANPDYRVRSWLLSQDYIPIEPGWSKPALVFWTKHYSERQLNFCYVEVQKEGSPHWDRLRVIGGSRDWYKASIDLSAYRGEKIRVKFFCEPQRGFDEDERARFPKLYNKQILYIQEVKIVSDSGL